MDFGQPINLTDAFPLIKEAAEIKQACIPFITEAIINNLPEGGFRNSAIRYYTGTRQGYVFGKEQIEFLLSQMVDNDVVVLVEASKLDDIITPNVNGKPTLVGFVYNQETSGDLKIKETNTNTLSGMEHPPAIATDLIDLINNGMPDTIGSGQVE